MQYKLSLLLIQQFVNGEAIFGILLKTHIQQEFFGLSENQLLFFSEIIAYYVDKFHYRALYAVVSLFF